MVIFLNQNMNKPYPEAEFTAFGIGVIGYPAAECWLSAETPTKVRVMELSIDPLSDDPTYTMNVSSVYEAQLVCTTFVDEFNNEILFNVKHKARQAAHDTAS